VVLGGLLQDDYQGNLDKVPGLGDVPLFGALFKNDSRTRKKTNLMVFLRPVVVRDGAATERLSLDRYEQMLSGMKESQPAPSSTVPINDGPLLPTLPPRPSTPAKN
jgi:general secretion pathway protein D